METWRLNELRGLSDGELALEVFKLSNEVENAASERAAAYNRMRLLEEHLEKAKDECSRVHAREAVAGRELAKIKKILEERLAK